MQDRLNSRVRKSIENYREREKALKKVEEALDRDEDFWSAGITIKQMVWWQADEWRRFFYERYDFDVERWRAEDPTDWPSLPQGRNPRETDEIVTCALAYAYWESISKLTVAMEKVAFKRAIDPGWAICAIFTVIQRYVTLRSDSGPTAWDQQYYSKLSPSLREELLVDGAGWVGSRVNLNVNKRLRAALSGWGKTPLENFVAELPGAILATYAEYDDSTQHRGSFVTRVARVLEDLGSESASRPGKLTSLSSEAAPEGSEDEYAAELEHGEILDILEQAAKFSPQQAKIWRRLRQDQSIAEIAAELGITENQVSVQKNHAIKKLREARKATGLS